MGTIPSEELDEEDFDDEGNLEDEGWSALLPARYRRPE
jgi:hypothetical protein